MGVSALKWQGWVVGLTVLAGLLVFAPLGLYVWASGEPGAAPPRPAVDDVRVTGCRVDAGSRRVVAAVEVAGRPGGPARTSSRWSSVRRRMRSRAAGRPRRW